MDIKSRFELYGSIAALLVSLGLIVGFVGEPWAGDIADNRLKDPVNIVYIGDVASKAIERKFQQLDSDITIIQSQQSATVGNQIRLEERAGNIEADVKEIKGDLKEILRRLPD